MILSGDSPMLREKSSTFRWSLLFFLLLEEGLFEFAMVRVVKTKNRYPSYRLRTNTARTFSYATD